MDSLFLILSLKFLHGFFFYDLGVLLRKYVFRFTINDRVRWPQVKIKVLFVNNFQNYKLIYMRKDIGES